MRNGRNELFYEDESKESRIHFIQFCRTSFFWPHFIKLFLVQFATACHLPRILFKLAWPVILLTIFKRLLSGNKRLSQQNYFFSAIHSSPFHSYFGVFFPLFFFCYCYCCRWFACIQTWHFYCFFSYKL